MKLQRYDYGAGVGTGGSWKDYDYNNQTWGTVTFTTDGNGSFSFPSGLRAGQYRIIEVTAPAGYENIYTAANAGKNISRVFAVPGSGATVSLYDPALSTLTTSAFRVVNRNLDSLLKHIRELRE